VPTLSSGLTHVRVSAAWAEHGWRIPLEQKNIKLTWLHIVLCIMRRFIFAFLLCLRSLPLEVFIFIFICQQGICSNLKLTAEIIVLARFSLYVFSCLLPVNLFQVSLCKQAASFSPIVFVFVLRAIAMKIGLDHWVKKPCIHNSYFLWIATFFFCSKSNSKVYLERNILSIDWKGVFSRMRMRWTLLQLFKTKISSGWCQQLIHSIFLIVFFLLKFHLVFVLILDSLCRRTHQLKSLGYYARRRKPNG
jgi:hypothetical protein